VNKTLRDDVYLFTNDKNVALAANEVVKLTDKHVRVVPTPDIVAGIAGLFALRSAGEPIADDELAAATTRVRRAQVFFAGRDATLGGVTVAKGKPAANVNGKLTGGESLSEVASVVLRGMGAEHGGLVTLYYGGVQKEKDAQRLGEEIGALFPDADVEYYYGGMKNAEYWISLDE
jgi:uncharacterized protein